MPGGQALSVSAMRRPSSQKPRISAASSAPNASGRTGRKVRGALCPVRGEKIESICGKFAVFTTTVRGTLYLALRNFRPDRPVLPPSHHAALHSTHLRPCPLLSPHSEIPIRLDELAQHLKRDLLQLGLAMRRVAQVEQILVERRLEVAGQRKPELRRRLFFVFQSQLHATRSFPELFESVPTRDSCTTRRTRHWSRRSATASGLRPPLGRAPSVP